MFSDLRLQHVRSYGDATFHLSPYVTVISGPNGSGKTTIAEALYIASRGASFKSPDGEVLKKDADWWRIDTRHGDVKRSVLYDPSKAGVKKSFIVSETKKARLAPQHKLPVVLFQPDDLRLLTGSPARRRAYIDALAAQLDPQFGHQARRYERALQQRNNLLKHHHATADELFVWDMALSEAGAYVLHARTYWLQQLNASVKDMYRDIAGRNDEIAITYSATVADDQSTIQQRLLASLHASQARDRVLGYTTHGPHRDDLLFSLNGSDAGHYASRGETRSIVLALKLVEIHLLMKLLDTAPLVLLDDVFSELDENRRHALVALSGPHIQTVITTTSAEVAKEYPVQYVERISLM